LSGRIRPQWNGASIRSFECDGQGFQRRNAIRSHNGNTGGRKDHIVKLNRAPHVAWEDGDGPEHIGSVVPLDRDLDRCSTGFSNGHPIKFESAFAVGHAFGTERS